MPWHEAGPAELRRLWPTARSAHVAATFGELQALAKAAPWRIRVSDSGDAMVLQPWRDHLRTLYLRAAWAPPQRLGDLVQEARIVAARHDYDRVLSPLVSASAFGPYEASGMSALERIVALQTSLTSAIPAASGAHAALRIRTAKARDLGRLVELEATCFDEFWRHGVPEVRSALATERTTVGETEGRVVGYAAVSLTGSSATLGRLAVAAEARRMGVGTLLVRDALAWAHASGALGVSVCTQRSNAAARSLYRAAGFAEVGEGYVIGACSAQVPR